MPIYDYVCGACGHRIEVVHGVHGHGPRACPSCGAEGTMRKAIAAPAVHFKGSGWAKKDRSATATPGKAKEPAPAATTSSTDAAAGSGAAGGASSSGDSGPASTQAKPSTGD